MHIVVYDIENAKPAKDNPNRARGEVSWDEARVGGAGISAVVVWDSLTRRPHLYDKHTVLACIEHLNNADLCVGWNSLNFDKTALEGFTQHAITSDQLDVRQYIIDAVGDKYARGYRLGEVTARTLNLYKNGEGTGAPELARQGRFAELFDYNLNDVWLTRALHNHIAEHRYVVTPDGKKLTIRRYPTKEMA